MNRPVNKLIKTNVFLAILSVLSVILVASGVSYALFKVENKNTENQVIAIGTLSINLTDNNAIEVLNLYPQTESSLNTTVNKIYTFTPSNTGDYAVNYEIYLSDTTNNVASNYSEYTPLNTLGTNYYQYINFKLDGGEVQNLGSVYNSSTGRMVIMTGYLNALQSAGEHTLQFWLSSTAPNDMIGTVLSLDITMEGTATQTQSKKTLLALGITPNTTATPDFNQNSPDDVQGVFAMEDDYGMSYYYRGNITNNYVKFGKYPSNYSKYTFTSSGTVYYEYPSLALCETARGTGKCTTDTSLAGSDMYWRIVRINGDGSIRMIYDGTSAHANGESSTDRVALQRVQWNNKSDDNKYVGYMYGGAYGVASTSKVQAQTNETNSNIKTVLETWYENVFKDTVYEKYISDEVFCNDRSTADSASQWNSSDTTLGYGKNKTYFGEYSREYNSDRKPSLECPQKNDAFTQNDTVNGNSALTYPIGLITADELNVGGLTSTQNTNNYLYKNTGYWSLSPFNFYSLAAVFNVNNGGINYTAVHNYYAAVPVINLSAEYSRALVGSGTTASPYHFE